ncbi:MAG TPA: primosomal protein N' [Pyrinomonadaceae bacterium]|nr:primosomal protein N' [Pyrinomonadaceae bacterium]
MEQASESSLQNSLNAPSISDVDKLDGPQYAEVAVPLHVATTFIYRIPVALRQVAQTGSRIVVPLGRQFVTGYIVALFDELRPGTSLQESDVKEAKDVLDVIPLVTPELLQLTRWVAEYYLAPWGEVIKAALPPGISPTIDQFLSLTEHGRVEISKWSSDEKLTSKQRLLKLVGESDETPLATVANSLPGVQTAKLARELEQEGLLEIKQRAGSDFVKPKFQRRVRLPAVSEASAESDGRRLTEAQLRILDVLKNRDSLPLPELLALANASSSSVNTLQKRNLVELFAQRLRRDPLGDATFDQDKDYDLTDEQLQVLAELDQPLRTRSYAAFLLHGVTGSGKTEVYIRAMRVALGLGRSALMLVPEIALTPVFSRRLRMHFGDRVAIFHSSLSRGERFDEWTRVRNGEARIVIGTRSAVFAPIKDLGLVIVDEEHESTYRQQDSPHYNGRDTAIVRGQKESAVVILGSATPSLESFHNANNGKYRYLQMPNRLGNRPMAVAEIVDMRAVFTRHQKPQIFSDELLTAIKETHQKQAQSIILLNRRGYSSFVLCRSCGESVQCPNCDVTLTYHRSERVIICHYCNHREAAPNKCPNCDGKYIYYVGEGTQQIEEQLRKLFPELRIARIDRDTASRRGSFEKSLGDFGEGKLDMLVGTQILAKGHDFPNVTLVGVVSVDAGMALPDFRAAERTFQLLTQVAGRAGRGDRAGKVLIQTYHPYHYALRHASAQDYAGFYGEEIRHRENLTYPPFVALASLLVHGTDLARVRLEAVELRKALDLANAERSARILGPAPAPLARLKGEFRVQLIIKCRNRRELRRIIDEALKTLSEQKINLRAINVEIDPVSIM